MLLWYNIIKGVGRIDSSQPALIIKKGAMTQGLSSRGQMSLFGPKPASNMKQGFFVLIYIYILMSTLLKEQR